MKIKSGFMNGDTCVPTILGILMLATIISAVVASHYRYESEFQTKYDPILVETTRIMISIEKLRPSILNGNLPDFTEVKRLEWNTRKIKEGLADLPYYNQWIIEAHNKWADSILGYLSQLKTASDDNDEKLRNLEVGYADVMANYCRLKATVNDQDNVHNSKKMGRRML